LKYLTNIAHLSDPHLTAPVDWVVTDLMNKRLLGYLSWYRRRRHRHQRRILNAVVADLQATEIDHTLVSGDLTHIGLTSEYQQAAVWLQGLGEPHDVSVVMGNHERYVDDQHTRAAALWQEYLQGDRDGDETSEQNILYPTLRVRGEVAILGVNTAVQSAPLFATGEVGRDQLARLEAQLNAQRHRFRIVMMHHSPLAHGHKWRKRLTDAVPLMEMCRDVGAELIVHGHGHAARFTQVESVTGPICVIAAPSASLSGEGQAGWNLYGIERREARWHADIQLRRFHAQTMRLEQSLEASWAVR
jgi:3',5'-cyclic AMP phosphodiesterase CpdA